MLLVFVVSYLIGHSQESPFILFGGDKNDIGNTLIEKTSGNGYLIGGSTRSFGNGSSDYYYIDIDTNYSIINQLSFGGIYYDKLSTIIPFDENYLLFGMSSKTISNRNIDFNSIFINELGEVLSNTFIRRTYVDVAYKAYKTSDNNYLAIGLSRSSQVDLTHGQCKLYKLSPAGSIILEKDFGENKVREYGLDVLENSLGYVVLSNINCELDLLAEFPVMKEPSSISVLQVDFNGDTIWEYKYPGRDYDYAYSMVQLKDHIYVAMNTRSGNTQSFDIKVLKIDMQGLLVDSFSFGGSDFEYANKIISDSNGDLLICGTTASNVSRPSFYAVKFDTSGTIFWEKTIEQDASIYANDVIETKNSNYLFTGKYSHNPDNSDVFLLELLPNGELINSIPEIPTKEELSVYPNPTVNRVIIRLNISPINSISIYNLKSQLVYRANYIGKYKSVVLDLGDLKTGSYILNVENLDGKIHNHKIIVN